MKKFAEYINEAAPKMRMPKAKIHLTKAVIELENLLKSKSFNASNEKKINKAIKATKDASSLIIGLG